MKEIDNSVGEHISNILLKYLDYQNSDDVLFKIKAEVEMDLMSLLEEHSYDDLIDVEILQDNDNSKLTLQPGNLFTLMFMHTGECPPAMLMPDKGAGKELFEWNCFRYSFVFDDSLDCYVPMIREI